MRFASLVMLLGAPLLSGPSQAGDAGAPSATVDCPRAAGPGRIRCEVLVRPAAGAVIRWADVQVTEVPPFASPLRARVGPDDASMREESAWRWTVALAARSRGSGSVTLRVRMVSCVQGTCAPAETVATGPLVVGE